MAIAAEKIQNIRERLDIASVVGRYVALKKKGPRYVGLCPFHAEKTPSFSVAADKGFFYCFGCHAGGDIFNFVMRHEGLDFHGAVTRLAKDAGVELEPESAAQKKQRQEQSQLTKVNAYAQAFFEHALWGKKGGAGRAYLIKRGIGDALAREWHLGFGGGKNELLRYLAAKKVPRALIIKAGLSNDDGSRSLFDDRLMFPVYDSLGRLAGFGGRRLGEDGSPKYINSKDSPLFSKRHLLFGWHKAEGAIRHQSKVVVVEGYLDVLACHHAGVETAVAALGTAFGPEHAKLCSRLANEAVVLLDGDRAGVAASRKVAEHLIHAHLKTLVVLLPGNEDPDSFVRKQGAQALLKKVAAAAPAVEHFMDQAFLAGAALSIEGKVAAARDLLPLLSAFGSGLERDLYQARLAERLGVSVERLQQTLVKNFPTERAPASKDAKNSPPSTVQEQKSGAKIDKLEYSVLREILLYPQLWPRLTELADFCQSESLQAVFLELALPESNAAATLTKHLDAKLVTRLLKALPLSNEAGHDERALRTFEDVLNKLKIYHLEQVIRDHIRQIEEAEQKGEETNSIFRRKQELTRRLRSLKAVVQKSRKST